MMGRGYLANEQRKTVGHFVMRHGLVRRRREVGAVLAPAALICASSVALGTDLSWLTATSGQWTDATKWTNGNVPDATNENALITATGVGYSVTVAGAPITMGGLTVN